MNYSDVIIRLENNRVFTPTIQNWEEGPLDTIDIIDGLYLWCPVHNKQESNMDWVY